MPSRLNKFDSRKEWVETHLRDKQRDEAHYGLPVDLTMD